MIEYSSPSLKSCLSCFAKVKAAIVVEELEEIGSSFDSIGESGDSDSAARTFVVAD